VGAGDSDPAVAALLQDQGQVSEKDYLTLTNGTNRLVEFVDGQIEVLPMPTTKHQAISKFLFRALEAVLERSQGAVFYAPLRLQIRPGIFREPDLLVLRAADDPRLGDDYWTGADLVIEIVSPGPKDAKRDYDDKRGEYEQLRIAEYWIVDPQRESITVLQLGEQGYTQYGLFRRGAVARSALFPELAVSVNAVLDAK
jgi:Uma2 family endonuclease